MAINKMEREGIISHVSSSVWITPILVVMKSDGQTPRICGNCQLTLNRPISDRR